MGSGDGDLVSLCVCGSFSCWEEARLCCDGWLQIRVGVGGLPRMGVVRHHVCCVLVEFDLMGFFVEWRFAHFQRVRWENGE